MVAFNPNYRLPFDQSIPERRVNYLGEAVRHYFDQQQGLARETNVLETVRPRLNAEDIRLHTWLFERLAAVHYERHGLWPRLRRLLFDNRLVRWLLVS
jgi:hypothetical protein